MFLPGILGWEWPQPGLLSPLLLSFRAGPHNQARSSRWLEKHRAYLSLCVELWVCVCLSVRSQNLAIVREEVCVKLKRECVCVRVAKFQV